MNNGLNGREDEMAKDLVKIFVDLQGLNGEDTKEQKQPTQMADYIHSLNLVLQSWDDPESVM